MEFLQFQYYALVDLKIVASNFLPLALDATLKDSGLSIVLCRTSTLLSVELDHLTRRIRNPDVLGSIPGRKHENFRGLTHSSARWLLTIKQIGHGFPLENSGWFFPMKEKSKTNSLLFSVGRIESVYCTRWLKKRKPQIRFVLARSKNERILIILCAIHEDIDSIAWAKNACISIGSHGITHFKEE